jgi:hypothetical protein
VGVVIGELVVLSAAGPHSEHWPAPRSVAILDPEIVSVPVSPRVLDLWCALLPGSGHSQVRPDYCILVILILSTRWFKSVDLKH